MLLVVDANVLIDFARSEPTVLALVVSHVGPVHVLRDVLEEVDQLTEADCDRLGLLVIDGTLDQLLEAGSRHGSLSFEDWLCLIVARDAGWTCVTNDGRLRRECEQVGVPTRWGLQLLIDVVVAGGMSAPEAASIGATISENNPWISAAVMAGFHKKLLEKPPTDNR